MTIKTAHLATSAEKPHSCQFLVGWSVVFWERGGKGVLGIRTRLRPALWPQALGHGFSSLISFKPVAVWDHLGAK